MQYLLNPMLGPTNRKRKSVTSVMYVTALAGMTCIMH